MTIPGLLPDGRDHVADHAERATASSPAAPAATTASTTQRSAPKRCPRRPSRLVPQHPGAHLLHGHGDRARLLRRLRPRPRCGFRALGRPALARARSSGHGATPLRPCLGRGLTDGDGPYVELMAGVFTDNQPDFSFLAPGETKTFSQYWYPIHQIGPAHQATTQLAVRLDIEPGVAGTEVVLGVAAAELLPGSIVELRTAGGGLLHCEAVNLVPGAPLVRTLAVGQHLAATGIVLTVRQGENELIRWQPRATQAPMVRLRMPRPNRPHPSRWALPMSCSSSASTCANTATPRGCPSPTGWRLCAATPGMCAPTSRWLNVPHGQATLRRPRICSAPRSSASPAVCRTLRTGRRTMFGHLLPGPGATARPSAPSRKRVGTRLGESRQASR